MPLIRVDLPRALFDDKGPAISREIHQAQIDSLDIPADDRFQLFHPHDDGEIIFDATYGGVDRRSLVVIQIVMVRRYQVDAAASALGGQYYGYALRGDGDPPRRPVPAAEQKAALDALAATLASTELVVPPRVLTGLAPRPSGYDMHRELFPRYTGLPFDPVTPGLTAADDGKNEASTT